MTHLTFAQAAWFLPFVLPICLYVTWTDLSRMIIPNIAVLALVAVYAIIGLMVLPMEEYLWRYVNLGVVLVIGFVLSSFGPVGAGDAKFAAAMAPFVAAGDGAMFLMLFCGVLLASWALHRMARATPALRNAAPDWVSWQKGKLFPMGVALAGSLILYLALGLT